MGSAILTVNNQKVEAINLTYDQLVILYKEFIIRTGRFPTTADGLAKNNLPQYRIIHKILKQKGIMYKDFMLQFGKVSKVRTENPEDYEIYLKKFLNTCSSLGRALKLNELMNNHYGLPSASWLVKFCPSEQVKTYKQFLDYYGLPQNKHIWTKQEVAEKLKQYEAVVCRPITTQDLTLSKSGVPQIAVNRLFGGITNAKKEIGLLATLPAQPLPFEYYKDILKRIITSYKQETGKEYITWRDIESGKYSDHSPEHKTYIKSFKRAGVDLNAYIRSLGCMLNPCSFSYTYTFEDGEKTGSNMEYEVTTHLREIGLVYNKDYLRTIRYNEFTNDKSRMDCDYCIITNSGNIYIEVAGMIQNIQGDWREKDYPSAVENQYRDKMIKKEKVLKSNNLNYLFLFANDISDGAYKNIINEALGVD